MFGGLIKQEWTLINLVFNTTARKAIIINLLIIFHENYLISNQTIHFSIFRKILQNLQEIS